MHHFGIGKVSGHSGALPAPYFFSPSAFQVSSDKASGERKLPVRKSRNLEEPVFSTPHATGDRPPPLASDRNFVSLAINSDSENLAVSQRFFQRQLEGVTGFQA